MEELHGVLFKFNMEGGRRKEDFMWVLTNTLLIFIW